MARFRIYAAKIEDMNQGWVWIGGQNLPQRSIVRLSTNDGRKVYCEILSIEDNFLNDYNKQGGGRVAITDRQMALVASEWYRTRLGLQTKTEAEIEVSSANCFCGQIQACLDHPQVVVRLAIQLGIWSVILAIISIILTIIPFFH